MQDKLRSIVVSICGILQRCEVRYMLVGGSAVALHGYYRHSMGPSGELASKPDIDIWFEPSYANYYTLLKALEMMGHDVSEFQEDGRPDPKRSFFRIELDEFTLDALPLINADIPFSKAYARKEEVELDGSRILYIGYDDLLEDKKSTARKKDEEDIRELKRHRSKE